MKIILALCHSSFEVAFRQSVFPTHPHFLGLASGAIVSSGIYYMVRITVYPIHDTVSYIPSTGTYIQYSMVRIHTYRRLHTEEMVRIRVKIYFGSHSQDSTSGMDKSVL
jgi:hypothetical protein